MPPSQRNGRPLVGSCRRHLSRFNDLSWNCSMRPGCNTRGEKTKLGVHGLNPKRCHTWRSGSCGPSYRCTRLSSLTVLAKLRMSKAFHGVPEYIFCWQSSLMQDHISPVSRGGNVGPRGSRRHACSKDYRTIRYESSNNDRLPIASSQSEPTISCVCARDARVECSVARRTKP